jgi:hypothetical protein
MLRRDLLTLAGAAALPAPALAQPAGKRVLKFIPQSDLGIIDPHITIAYVTRHHGFLVFDTLWDGPPLSPAALSWQGNLRDRSWYDADRGSGDRLGQK